MDAERQPFAFLTLLKGNVMSVQSIERQFFRIGAPSKDWSSSRSRKAQRQRFSIDIGVDTEGEFFELSIQPRLVTETQVLDLQPELRHLLLMSRQDDGKA